MIIRNATERMEVILDLDQKTVTVVQRWKCRFLADRRGRKWREGEKRSFRKKCRTFIESTWSRAAHMVITSTTGSAFNQKYGGTRLLVHVRLEFVDIGEHWTAVAYKTKDPLDVPDFVHWQTREIYLSHRPWVNPTGVRNADGTGAPCQLTIAHEFGHTLGNCPFTSGGSIQYLGDEYEPDNPFYYDKCSIMNIGSELRSRHFSYIRDLLQSMVPGTEFTIEIGGVMDLIPWYDDEDSD